MDEIEKVINNFKSPYFIQQHDMRVKELRQAIWEVVERSLPNKKEIPEYDFEYTGNADDNEEYGQARGELYGFNQALTDTTTALKKAILGEGK